MTQFPECLYEYDKNVTETAAAKISGLERKNKILMGPLRLINNGFKVEYGHLDSDRYNRQLKHWNEIIIKTLKEVG